jgi:autotransporter translocation and assembly factor TamB
VRADSIEALVTLENGKARLQRADARIIGRVDSAAAYFGMGGKVDGYVDVDVSMKGGFDNPIVNARLRGRDLRYDMYALDTVSGFASMENNTVRWNSFYLRGMGSALQSSGRLTLGDNMELSSEIELFDELESRARTSAGKLIAKGSILEDTIKGSFRLTSLPLRMLDPWLPEEHRVRGTLSFSGEFSGTTANPSGRVNFRLANPSYAKHSIYLVVGDAALADSSLSAAVLLRVSGNSSPLELKALMPFLPSSGWKIDEIGKRPALVSAALSKFDLSELSAIFLEPDCKIAGLATLGAEVTRKDGAWNVGGSLSMPDADVRYEPQGASVGGVNLNVNLSGTLEKPRAAFTLATGRADMASIRMDRCFIKGYSGIDTLALDSARFVFRDSGFVDVKGRLFYGGLDSLFYNQNFYAQYVIRSLPVSAFTRLIPNIRLRNGVINGSGLLHAADGRPLVNGSLSMTGTDVVIPDINPTLGPLNATLRFVDSTVHIASMNARWGRGSISAQGRTSWGMEKISDMNLRVRASDIFIGLPDVVNVGVANTDLQIYDRNSDIIVSGRITMGPTSYVRDLNFIELINQMQISAGVRRAPNPFLQSVQLYVALDLANNVGADMNLGSLLMDGRLTIAGTANEPGIVGEIKIVDGFVYYLDRKFMIAEGTIFNPDHSAINPNIRIVAKTEISTFSPNARSEQFTITLSVTGTMENPVVRFMAEPALSELDILSILTFGERMGGMGSDMNNRLMNIAAQQAIGFGTRRLEKLLNLDRVSVSGDLLGSGSGQSAGATIGVSKRFTSRLNISYETNTNTLNDNKVTAQYRLLPNLYLEGLRTGEGESALDLILRYSR